VDPLCNPKNPVRIHFADISSAAFNIRDGIVHSPTVVCNLILTLTVFIDYHKQKSTTLSSMFSVEMYFKKEYLQVTGSFKERGARFALMRLNQEQRYRIEFE
jgi:threonine dehydratase